MAHGPSETDPHPNVFSLGDPVPHEYSAELNISAAAGHIQATGDEKLFKIAKSMQVYHQDLCTELRVCSSQVEKLEMIVAAQQDLLDEMLQHVASPSWAACCPMQHAVTKKLNQGESSDVHSACSSGTLMTENDNVSFAGKGSGSNSNPVKTRSAKSSLFMSFDNLAYSRSKLEAMPDVQTVHGNVIRHVVFHPLFEVASSFIVFVNAVMIGIDTAYMSEAPDKARNTFFLVFQQTLNIWYILELGLRVYAEGYSHFLVSRNWRWNWFDLLLVFMSLLDIFYETSQDGGFMLTRVLRGIRLVRVVRTLRILRVFRYTREFRKMVYAIGTSVQTLFWSLVLLVFDIYCFAVFFTQATLDFFSQQDEPNSEREQRLLDLYGTLSKSLLSLYLAMSGGLNWGVGIEPLFLLDWTYSALYLLFISITIFGVLNIVTSVFVDSAMQSTQYHRDLLVQENLRLKERYVRHMKEIFRQIDTDNSGEISINQIDRIFGSDELRQYLEAIEIEPCDARVLFKLLDQNESGTIDIEEFCNGCMRLKGEAKSFDMYCLIYNSERSLEKTKSMTFEMQEMFKHVQKQIYEVSRRVGQIRKDLKLEKDRGNSLPRKESPKEMSPRGTSALHALFDEASSTSAFGYSITNIAPSVKPNMV